MDKEELIHNIKEWIKLDTEIGVIMHEIKEKKKCKGKLTENIVKVMKENQLENIDISGGGSLIYKETKVKKPIGMKSLQQLLSTYFKENQGTATDLTTFLMSNRSQELKESICKKK